MQNPLVISSDELSEQRPVILDRGRRVDRPQDGRTSRNLELDERRLRRAAVQQAVGVASLSLDAEVVRRR